LVYEDQPADAAPHEPPQCEALHHDQAKHLAHRMRQAAEIGDVTELSTLVSELSPSGAATPLCKRIQELVNTFDFKGITSLANKLEGMG